MNVVQPRLILIVVYVLGSSRRLLQIVSGWDQACNIYIDRLASLTAELPWISWCSFLKKTENFSDPNILRGYFRARCSLESVCTERRKFWQIFPANCPTIIRTRKSHCLQQLNLTHSKLNGLLFWVFIVFGSWQITRNATKSESVALKRTDL